MSVKTPTPVQLTVVETRPQDCSVCHCQEQKEADGQKCALELRTGWGGSVRRRVIIPSIPQVLRLAEALDHFKPGLGDVAIVLAFTGFRCEEAVAVLIDSVYLDGQSMINVCASLLIASGVSDMQVAHQMGHSKVETTKNIYGHLFAGTVP